MPLAEEIRGAINKYSRENVSNTPDFILAEYLMSCLVAFETASIRREDWYGRHLSIGVNARLDTKDGQTHNRRITKCPKCGSSRTCYWMAHDKYGCYDCDWIEGTS